MTKLSLVFITLFIQLQTFAQNSQPVKIVEKPRAIWKNEKAQICNVEGTVRIKVEFLANGEIGKITLVSDLPLGLSKAALEAAPKIKFEPAKENGVAKTVSKIIEYAHKWDGKSDFIFNNRKQPLATIDEKADVIINKAVARLGGEKYISAKTVVRRGNYSQIEDGVAISSSPFVDYIALPDKERTDFKFASGAIVQTNVGDKGWIYEAGARAINDQNSTQIENYKQSLRTSLDYFLRGTWRGEKGAKVEYSGKRRANFSNQNDVVILTYGNGLKVEFEFEANGTPAKLSYERKNSDGAKIIEEDRFAQFIDINGVFAPFIIDRYRDGKQISRINYTSIEINAQIPNATFDKPANVKKLKINK